MTKIKAVVFDQGETLINETRCSIVPCGRCRGRGGDQNRLRRLAASLRSLQHRPLRAIGETE